MIQVGWSDTEGTADHITDGAVGPLTLNVSYQRSVAPYLAIRPHVSLVRIGDSAGRRLLDPPGDTVGVAVVVEKKARCDRSRGLSAGWTES